MARVSANGEVARQYHDVAWNNVLEVRGATWSSGADAGAINRSKTSPVEQWARSQRVGYVQLALVVSCRASVHNISTATELEHGCGWGASVDQVYALAATLDSASCELSNCSAGTLAFRLIHLEATQK